MVVAGGLLLGIRLRFHHHTPQQLAIRLAFHQQAADELGCNLLGGAGEEGWGKGLGGRWWLWELLWVNGRLPLGQIYFDKIELKCYG